MRAAVACAAAAALAQGAEAAAIQHSAGEHRTARLRQSYRELKDHFKLSDTKDLDAELNARAQKTRFGPGNCISTWRNEDGHCQVDTHCKEHDLSKYPVKLICIDDGGEKVRHVFAVGSFDPEESFDTLIECKQCLAEKEETIQVIAEPAHEGSHGKHEKKKKEDKVEKKDEESDESKGSPLKALKAEVKELEGFMMSTSEVLQKLNAKVYSKNFAPSAQPAPPSIKVGTEAAPKAKEAAPKAKEAAPKAKAKAKASSFVHHRTHHEKRSTVVQQQIVDPVRVQAQADRVSKAHRKHLKEDDEGVKGLAANLKEAKDVAASLTGALKTAEERAHKAPVQQPAKVAMVLPKASPKKTKKKLVVSLPQAHDATNMDYDGEDITESDDYKEEDSSIPQSADEFERQQEEADRPSLSALQQHQDDDDEHDEQGEEISAGNFDEDSAQNELQADATLGEVDDVSDEDESA